MPNGSLLLFELFKFALFVPVYEAARFTYINYRERTETEETEKIKQVADRLGLCMLMSNNEQRLSCYNELHKFFSK